MSSRPTISSAASWTVPFVLGATTALSLVYLQNKLHHEGKGESKSTKKPSSTTRRAVPPPSSNNENTTTTTNNTTIMDAPDLDQRMLRKAEAVIQWRTTRLILVIERCTNDHNYSAILRTAEALGIQLIYMIDPPDIEEDVAHAKTQKQQYLIDKATPEELEQRRQHHFFARNAQEWLTIRDFETTEEGYDLWVTDLSQQAECLTVTTPKVPDKVALVMGTEAVGCSQYMLDIADKRVYLPLRGFADSLNLSVATALVIHHLFVMDPTLIGGITEDEKHALRMDWYAKLCQQRLLTNSQKKLRQKLMLNIQKCQMITERMGNNKEYFLQPSEKKKLNELPNYETQLAELNALLDPVKVQAAVDEWVRNPPPPLTDVRRADLHRICYVGKNTKTKHQDHWKDMVATSDQQSMHGQTSSTFRDKVNATAATTEE
eukprot:CAMPEP_0117077758 /NCGR_PEP_ID=MMETSP0472-20121206/54808_1 /TAXON_ID=693140 ORGANISM="Tiarina fusus, Strain LIS" /NCGR_SAMPLE_ID=MMETSP0472 /ASSEMBLY_ACC=CAM_ASM_000603 /LENGTH=431 /DNA_ID=CAMNT_0004804187 /DNA_START=89 /DNA_END=1384 /DNA_ORIENTATION=+